jgi:tetratricopeptide (TPR) repeat protein
MKGVNLEEAMSWADLSIQANRNFSNLWTKGLLHEKMGKPSEGKKTKEEALSLADEAEVNALGYQYLTGGSVQEALTLFTINVQKHPESWNAYDSLGEGYAVAGKTALAIENYSKALSMVSDEAQKSRIQQVLTALKAK